MEKLYLPDLNHRVSDIYFDPKVTGSLEVGFQSPAEHLSGLNREPSDFQCNALRYYATLPRKVYNDEKQKGLFGAQKINVRELFVS